MDTNDKKKRQSSEKDRQFPLPVYEPADDIYSKDKELSFEEIDGPDEMTIGNNSENLGGDLDTPGTELDDSNEAIGEEDEENNYYSLGGENHEDLEEGNSDIL